MRSEGVGWLKCAVQSAAQFFEYPTNLVNYYTLWSDAYTPTAYRGLDG
jgi:hypothetical protein